MDESFDESKLKEKFPFPENVSREWAEKTTELFARKRSKYPYYQEGDNDIYIERNPTFEAFLTEYPLPADIFSMILWFTKKEHSRETFPKTIFPLVERFDTYIGLVHRVEGDNTIGYFLGLVEPYDYFHLPDNDWQNLTEEQGEFLLTNMFYKFIDGIVLLEGKLDKSVIRQIEDFEKDYNENILGKLTPGRPRYDPEDYLGPARPIVRRYPDILQKDLVKRIGCDERTFRRWRELAGFDTFRKFKNSVLKK